MSGWTEKGDHIYYTVRYCGSFYFLPDDVAAFCEGWVLYRLGKQGQDMQEGWWERVGGRGMFREKPRQLTDVGSTAEPPTPRANPSHSPLPQKKRVEKKCPQQQAYRHVRFRV